MATIYNTAYEYFTKHVEGREKCLSYFGRTFSGNEVKERIDGVAAFLREKGIKRGDVVAIHLPNTPECIFSIYAINKLGAVAFVTHPMLPVQALKESLTETGAKLLIVMDHLAEEVGIPKIVCDGISYLPAVKRGFAKVVRKGGKAKGIRFPYRAKGDAVSAVGNTEDVALYLPSGGTTGEPKVIRVTNSAFNANADATLTLAKMPLEGHAVLLLLPFFHGFGLSSSLHGAVSGGAEGVIFPYPDYPRAAKCVKRGKGDILLAVPNMYKKLLAQKAFRKGIGNMRLAFSGGDTLSVSLKREYDALSEKAGGESRLYQGYGLAETVSVCVANSRGSDKAGSIGKPVFSEVKILSEEGAELPAGQVGEIAVATPCMMKGYLGQEDFCEKYLRTGDLGYFDQDGFLVFSGRKKRIIVIGGMNVYPLEIERVACEEDFAEGAAAVEYREDGKPKIALFVAEHSPLPEKEKKDRILKRLCGRIIRYAIPSKIVFLPELPLTKVGKTDHAALLSYLGK